MRLSPQPLESLGVARPAAYSLAFWLAYVEAT